MQNTLDKFKSQQLKTKEHLERLVSFLKQGSELGIEVDTNIFSKLETALGSLAGDKLKIALIGGFSEGKTSIAAAWMEQLDKSSMKISHQESSNEVKIYDIDSECILIDTPGLFGFKEQENTDTKKIEKYKDITKKYISEAHLVLYVMNSANPIKNSHKEDLEWLFRTLNLLPRTIFILSRFDEVADIEDESEYEDSLTVKQNNVSSRLQELLKLEDKELIDLTIVGVAANPFDEGTEYWLKNLEEFRKISHISTLQKATTNKIASSGGAKQIIMEAQKSIISDVLTKQLPVVVENDELLTIEVDRLRALIARLEEQLNETESQILKIKISLKDFVTGYFTDLILQAKGSSLDTFMEFFEREIGSKGINLNTKLQNEFDRQIGGVSLEVNRMELDFDKEVGHFNTAVKQLGKQGLDSVIKGNLINRDAIIATRDGVSAVAKAIGLNLGDMLKFKPWGAVNLAKGLNGVLAVLGLALEVWDSWKEHKREEEFDRSIKDMVSNFEKQREELINDVIGSDKFKENFFPKFIDLQIKIDNLKKEIKLREERHNNFHNWRNEGEIIEAEFKKIS